MGQLDGIMLRYEALQGLAQRGSVFLISLLRIVLSIPLCSLTIVSAYRQDTLMDVDLELHTVVDTFIAFLIVAIHQIVRELNIYSKETFITAREYNLPVHQIRHPGLCEYINGAATAVYQEILTGTVKCIKVATLVQESWLEQFVFDITQLCQPDPKTITKDAGTKQENSLVDAEEQLRGVLSKLQNHCKNHCKSLEPSNGQKEFRIIIEEDESPMLDSVNKQQWEDMPNTRTDDDCHSGEYTANMVKISSVQAGRLVFALWYESPRTLSHTSTYTPDQLLASDGLTGSPSTDAYGTFPLTQNGA
jgi:mitotic spindle assembly checkpoint protein MAD2B